MEIWKKPESVAPTRLELNEKELEKLNKKMSALVDLYMEGDVSRDIYHAKKDKLEDQIAKIEKQNNELKKQMADSDAPDIDHIKRDKVRELLNMRAVSANSKVPDSIVDAFVEEVIYYQGTFSWYLNFDNPSDEGNVIDIEDTPEIKASRDLVQGTTNAPSSTGSYRRVTSVSETSCFLGTFEISKDFMRQSSKIYHKKNGFRFPEKLVIKLFLV